MTVLPPPTVDLPGIDCSCELVRPYALTRGRTFSPLRLAPETLASSAGEISLHPGLFPELEHILLLCRTPTAVVEIAAVLRQPLGVAEVLVADLAERGLLSLIRPAAGADGRPPRATLERILWRLRADG